MKKERQGEVDNLGPEGAHQKQKEAEGAAKVVKLMQINITQMDKNGKLLLTQDADVLCIAEHKLSKQQIAEWCEKFEDAIWVFAPSPANEKGKTPQAGVGIAAKSQIAIIKGFITKHDFPTHVRRRPCL